jgi:hypothetical protein
MMGKGKRLDAVVWDSAPFDRIYPIFTWVYARGLESSTAPMPRAERLTLEALAIRLIQILAVQTERPEDQAEEPPKSH